MPMDKWPCVPDGFSSILQGEVPFFLQTGAVHTLGRATSIIDPRTGERFDPQNRFDKFQPFCKCLRGDCLNRARNDDLNQNCLRCDQLVAGYVARNAESVDKDPQAIRYRCYMGLEEMAYLISVGEVSFMLVAGQFLPAEGSNDIKTSLQCLGIRRPNQSDVSPAMWKSISDFGFSEDLWTSAHISNEDRDHLLLHVDALTPRPDSYEDEMRKVALRISEIAHSYYEMTRAKIESKTIQATAKAFSKAIIDDAKHWNDINDCLEVFRSGLDVQYVAFFSGYRELDTVLNLRASAGNIPNVPAENQYPHFNWRKAELMTGDEKDTHETWRDWQTISLKDHDAMMKGFRGRGTANLFSNCSAVYPTRLPTGPFGVLVLGPHNSNLDISRHNDYLSMACRDVSSRILTLQLSRILQVDRSDWEKTSKMTGHRVRAAIQSLGSQLNIIKAFHRGDPDITDDDHESAESTLVRSFQDLTEVSYAAEATIPRAIDVKITKRDSIGLGNIVLAAISDQAKVARENDIEIVPSDELPDLLPVFANPALLRYAFVNIINNALKYSNPHPTQGSRIVYINTPPRDPGQLIIDIVNFGLGIKRDDLGRIFEWGVRLSNQNPLFQGVFGRGVGLWEAKNVIEGHGGKIYVRSAHYSDAPVTDDNIQECVTHFTVVLLQA